MITLPAAVCAALDKALDNPELDRRDINAVAKTLPKAAAAWVLAHPLAYSRAIHEGFMPLEEAPECSHEWISADPDLAHSVDGCRCADRSIRERTCEICGTHERRCNTCPALEVHQAG